MEQVTTNELVDMAIDLISDYPLYASTDGITENEIIEIAKVLYPDPTQWASMLKDSYK